MPTFWAISLIFSVLDSGFFSLTSLPARSTASLSKSVNFIVPPERVLNGLPSLPIMVPKAWCSS